jgi:hypothetical protein
MSHSRPVKKEQRKISNSVQTNEYQCGTGHRRLEGLKATDHHGPGA